MCCLCSSCFSVSDVGCSWCIAHWMWLYWGGGGGGGGMVAPTKNMALKCGFGGRGVEWMTTMCMYLFGKIVFVHDINVLGLLALILA